MIKEFKKYDKEAQRTVYIKTEKFNELLESVNAPVKVIPRVIDLENRYEAYLHNCSISGKEPMSESEYDREIPHSLCSFEVQENAPAELLISKALDMKAIKVEYAKDSYGRVTDDELEIRYHIA